jgi:dienelactone hydrolase
MTVLNNSDSVIIVLHEIYGINPHILKVCEYFKTSGFDVICPDLLNLNEPFDYDQEEVAYEYFMTNVGFDLASKKVRDLIAQTKGKYKHIFLLGFSIGATIAWLCSDEEPICEGIIGYYGSRIRNYLKIIPKCPTLLIFAAEEKSFNVMELSCILEKKTNVDIHVLLGKHGFSDPFSKRYYKQSDQDAEKLVDDFLKREQI